MPPQEIAWELPTWELPLMQRKSGVSGDNGSRSPPYWRAPMAGPTGKSLVAPAIIGRTCRHVAHGLQKAASQPAPAPARAPAPAPALCAPDSHGPDSQVILIAIDWTQRNIEEFQAELDNQARASSLRWFASPLARSSQFSGAYPEGMKISALLLLN